MQSRTRKKKKSNPTTQARAQSVVVPARSHTIALPVEVVYNIFQYAEDKTQLLALALACRRYQPEAERLLYERIEFQTCDKASRACLRTIRRVPRKALFVRWFWITWKDPVTSRTLWLLGNALLAMTSLKSLHLRLSEERIERIQTIMNSCLERCTFSLDTLFISNYLDLAAWVPRQTSLNCIGTFIASYYRSNQEQLPVYKAFLQRANLSSVNTQTDTIRAHPMFAQGSVMVHRNHPALHVMCLSGLDTFEPLLTSVAQHFPEVCQLRIIARDRDIQVNPYDASSLFSTLPGLRHLLVQYHDSYGSNPFEKSPLTNPNPPLKLWQRKVMTRLEISDGTMWIPPIVRGTSKWTLQYAPTTVLM